jgi:hypothetical protein
MAILDWPKAVVINGRGLIGGVGGDAFTSKLFTMNSLTHRCHGRPLQHVMFFKIKEKKTSNKGFGNGRHESPSSLCILAKSSDNGDPLPAHDFLKKEKNRYHFGLVQYL